MYPTHDELIEFIHLLDYSHSEDGFCFGLVAMAISPPLTKSTEKANQRLQKIKASLDAYKEMQISCEKDGETCPTLSWFLDYTLALDEKIDILAYCQGVAFHFDPAKHKDYFSAEEYVRQNILLTNKIIQSIETEEATGLALAGRIIYHYTSTQKGSDIKNYISFSANALNALKTTPSFSCAIHSKDHTIHIAYCVEAQQWCYFVINGKELKFCYTSSNDEISNLIESEFFADDCNNLVLTTEIYCLNKHKEEIIKFRNSWDALLAHSHCQDILQNKMQQDSLGNTWLCELALYNDTTNATYLISNNVNVNLENGRGYTALDIACYMGHKDMVRILAEAGADVHKKITVHEYTYILMAIRRRHYEIVKFLIEKNVDLKAKDEYGFTALDYAIALKKMDIVECILTKMHSPEMILNQTILKLFLEQQKIDPDYVLSSDTEKFFNAILNKHQITDDNKITILQLYIIVRENECRKTGNQYNSGFGQFFSPAGSNSQAKLNAAKALLSEEKGLEKRSALQSGRLGRIAAFFLNSNDYSQQNYPTSTKQAILTT